MTTSEIVGQPLIYMDHSASTPVDGRVLEAMLPYMMNRYGNPSGLHRQARAGARAIERARQDVAEVLGCLPREVIFTAGGTESYNLAIRGIALAAHQAGRGQHIVTSAIEHEAVGRTVDQLCQASGFERTLVPVDEHGRIDPKDVCRALRPDTVLVSLMYANNEVGVIQPLADIGACVRERGIPLHTDAVQAGGYLDLNMARLNIDLLSLSAHKFYGPKGVGVLAVRQGMHLLSQQTGGGHEWGWRAGTENVPGIVGLAAALKLAKTERDRENYRLRELRWRLIDGIQSAIPDAQLTGHPEHRLPGHASFVFPGVDASALVLHLDRAGICAASGSACNSRLAEPSRILLATGIDPRLALGALRLTLGRSNTLEDVAKVVEILPAIVEELRQARPVYAPIT